MPNLPVRGLGSAGVITDVSPYDLPIGAWSNSRNVRFEGDAVTRASVFKPFILSQDFTASPPIYVVDDTLRGTSKSISTLRANGTITRVADGVISDVSPSPALSTTTENVTGTTIGSVSYINNAIDPPVSYTNSETRYSTIPHWPTGYRCKSLRSYGDFLIAINLSNTIGNFPNSIRWSDAVQVGTRPKWALGEENSLAGDNVLNGSSGFLIDGFELGSMFVIYGSHEVFAMNYVGAPFIFEFRKLFSNFSIMTQNCVVEVNSMHFVFCEDDIVNTDGGSYQSICNARTRKAIFSRIDYSKRENCRVIHNSLKSEILFCYASNAGEAAWLPNELGCNEAAVYNYANDTWSFIDLPNVICGTEVMHPIGAVEEASTWEGIAIAWDESNDSWSFTTASPMTLVLATKGDDNTVPGKLYFYDDAQGGRIGNAADTNVFWQAWSEMTLHDFDSLGISITSAKLVKSFAPQVITENENQYVTYYIKAEPLNTSVTNWTDPFTYNPYFSHIIDTRISGRYISLRYEIPEQTVAKFSGFDIDVMKISGR